MAYLDFDIVQSVKHWFSEFAIHRQELRTERHLNSLPEHLLKDIGWPDAYAERLAKRNSLGEDDTAVPATSDELTPWQLDWPKHYESLKARKSSPLELGC
ncbi:uncharacterized protein YjiS (DUF1127 family) [Phyllobacterium ifriqiyense]|uniref:Uncharacterized protein YjiS (DUF1127 family) n=1 Tax=Phyllobacterium ifriqiyense TaxID=314238 RepID=A0ABU0S8V4_9HYPH|nr:hypothetical protein [Phyllobacterium ifriqiyense]MDQ0997192.1 uncharacterized protein YjiS (DUF1127 family) [Phyllobacterium ifriqiyense]